MIEQPELTEALREFQIKNDVPGVTAVLFDRNGPLVAAATGLRSIEEPDAALRPDTLFRIYSTAKTLTATLAAALVDSGELGWDEPVAATLPEFRLRRAHQAPAVTLRHLLSHRAGFIPDMVLHEGCSRDRDAVAVAAQVEPPRTPLVGRPGQVYSYSNLGFTVAGHLLERRAGTTFDRLFTERIAEPLGMTRTWHDPSVAMTYPLLQHHRLDAGTVRVIHEPRVAAKHAPSSQCWSTVLDLARVGAAHLAADPADRGLRELRQPQADVRLDVDLHYGLGLYLGPRAGDGIRFGHEGFYEGMWTKLLCCPASGLGLVWADNRGEELREARYQVINDLFMALGGATPNWTRPARSVAVGPPPSGRYERPASGSALRLVSHSVNLDIITDDRTVSTRPVAVDVWAAEATPAARMAPPWRPHAGSDRVSVGAVRDDQTGEVTHVLLNGLPYRRADHRR
ncbi:serine hydrolase domain-containing protein [Micromonospora sp. WMMD1082]|uniref:serine hydrolase domain-containing protein n=1 Tax=Micromonospora sp. WMMD1082 TaxID=3016104 RepID=UPI0024161DED|nr:serine hydrolase domain-containing protein [Micromonospora sp. WMMD1082]MDG4795679.1 serine hydrolase [Micromonospora sp. WMMD1082]